MNYLYRALLGFALLVCVNASGQTALLPYQPLAAQYSTVLNRIVMTTTNPNQLHIYDPVSNSDATVSLPSAPAGLSISPDGLSAAVVVSTSSVVLVNLANQTIVRTYSFAWNPPSEPTSPPTAPPNVALGSAYIYLLPTSTSFQTPAVSINIATGVATTNNVNFVNGGYLNPVNNVLYGDQDGSYPEALSRYDTSTGPVTGVSSPLASRDFSNCGPLWFSADGKRIYTGCGTFFYSSTDLSQDMSYGGNVVGGGRFQSLAEDTTHGIIAVVEPYGGSNSNGYIILYDSAYLRPLGQLQIASFTVGTTTYTGYGKYIFYNAATSELILIKDAGGFASVDPYAVQRISLSARFACGASFASATASVPATGSNGTANITADNSCVYQVVSDSPWLQLLTGAIGSGNGTLSYIARANPTGAARTATIAIEGQTMTVTQPGAVPTGPPYQLAYNVVDSKYSKSLDKLIMVVASPDELHIYDPVSQADQIVPLPTPPLSVSVRPDGLYAAVGHIGWVSIVNLQTAKVEQVLPVPTDVTNLVLASNGYAYPLSGRDYTPFYSLQLSSGTVTSSTAGAIGQYAALTADGESLFLSGYDYSSKWDISSGVGKRLSSNPLPPIEDTGGIWLSEDGQLLFRFDDTVYMIPSAASLPPQSLGSFPLQVGIVSAANSRRYGSTAVIPYGQVDTNGVSPNLGVYLVICGDNPLDITGVAVLPNMTVQGYSAPMQGNYVYWNNAETSLVVLGQAQPAPVSNPIRPWAVYVVNQSAPASGCTYSFTSPSTFFPASTTSGYVGLTTGDSCIWSASSSAPWLTLTGGFGIGSAYIAFNMSSNNGAFRTANITVGGQVFTVTQSSTALPFGYIDAPAPVVSGVSGAIGITGWAVSASSIKNISFWREPVPSETATGLIFVANVPQVPGARPDVVAAYPNYPAVNSAGWGAQILTNELPGSGLPAVLGDGTYKVHILANDLAGNSVDLGTRTITAKNSTAQIPFGTIDTPAPGATISGSAYVNFGWALTPNKANVIPKDGSTIVVYIDNQAVGHPVYNNYRPDIANLFPGLQNSQGGVGYYTIDTTKLSNGLHSIAWSVQDSAGGLQGIGSRNFIVSNP